MSRIPAVYHTGLDVSGRRVLVMGLGRFGGGVGVTRWLAQAGARVLVTDRAPEDALAESVAALADLDVEWRLGEHREEDFRRAEILVLSPAVPSTSPLVRQSLAAGALLDTEINILLKQLQDREVPVLAVTGSAGKSTTSALAAEALKVACAGTVLGGNIGGSLLPAVETVPPGAWAVLELSSFMLEHVEGMARDGRPWSPEVGVVTGLAPDHLERHGGWEAYVDAKRTVVRRLGLASIGAAVLPADDPAVSSWAVPGGTWWFGMSGRVPGAWEQEGLAVLDDGRAGLRSVLDFGQARLCGAHNRRNMLAALCAAVAAGVDADVAAAAISAFAGLPHRLESLGPAGGVAWINDSKATGPAEGAAGVLALAERGAGFVLLAGGRAKDGDYGAWAKVAAQAAAAGTLRGAVLSGEAAAVLDLHLAEAGVGPLRRAAGLGEALGLARDLAMETGAGTVLFSPACTSYDAYANYEERGEDFRRRVGGFIRPAAS